MEILSAGSSIFGLLSIWGRISFFSFFLFGLAAHQSVLVYIQALVLFKKKKKKSSIWTYYLVNDLDLDVDLDSGPSQLLLAAPQRTHQMWKAENFIMDFHVYVKSDVSPSVCSFPD